MQRPTRLVRLFLSCGLALSYASWTAGPVGAQIPDKFTNLKVLPRDISKQQLVDMMKNITFELGTRCWLCHKGEGDDLATYDFASDEKSHKETARRHLLVTREVNEKYFTGTGEEEVTCNTCHRGQTEPEP